MGEGHAKRQSPAVQASDKKRKSDGKWKGKRDTESILTEQHLEAGRLEIANLHLPK